MFRHGPGVRARVTANVCRIGRLRPSTPPRSRGTPIALSPGFDAVPRRRTDMAVKKPLRRKRARARSRVPGFVKAFRSYRSYRWTGTSGISVAVAFAALMAVLVFAYSASPPATQTDERPAAPAEEPRPAAPRESAGPPALARKQPPPAPTAPAEDSEPVAGITTGPMPPVVTLHRLSRPCRQGVPSARCDRCERTEVA